MSFYNYKKSFFSKTMTYKILLIFQKKIDFEAITLLQIADLNKGKLENYKSKKKLTKIKTTYKKCITTL